MYKRQVCKCLLGETVHLGMQHTAVNDTVRQSRLAARFHSGLLQYAAEVFRKIETVIYLYNIIPFSCETYVGKWLKINNILL